MHGAQRLQNAALEGMPLAEDFHRTWEVAEMGSVWWCDRVNHDRLMAAVAARVSDRRVLRLIRGYLRAGVLNGGLFEESGEGTPQGGPLTP